MNFFDFYDICTQLNNEICERYITYSLGFWDFEDLSSFGCENKDQLFFNQYERF